MIRKLIALGVAAGSAFAAVRHAGAQAPEPTLEAVSPAPSPTITPTFTPSPIPFPTLPPNFESEFRMSLPAGLSGRIAFTAKVGELERIFVLDLDSKRVRKLIEGPGNSSYPAWSPNGELIAFTSDRDGNKEIYVADWNGSNHRRITRNNKVDDNAVFSPDGANLLYYSGDEKGERGSRANLFSIPVTGGEPRAVTSFSDRNTTPQWAPDGKSIAFSTNRFWPGWQVCIWFPEQRRETCPLRSTADLKSYCRPAWSSSGALLAYSVGIGNEIDIGFWNRETGDRQQLTDFPGREYDAVWSPSGRQLAFVAENGRSDIFNMYISDLKNRTASALIRSELSIRYLSWSARKTIDLEAERIRRHEQSLAQEASAASPAPALPSSSTPAAGSSEKL